MRRFSNSTCEEENGIDLTPMLDVVFIMLIFFIVTSSFVKESGVDINRPSAKSATTVKNGNILVALRPNDEIWIDKRLVDLSAVRANIERLHAEMPQSAVVVQADNDSKSGLLIQLIDQIKLAGIDNVSVSAAQE
ncbi:MAG: biopolymer transporter ExbD [Sulfuricurvum sp. PC08-66]|nr:MAG: biopolymer transporter ExbD [Sulfuricurvum sp. PC08-66]